MEKFTVSLLTEEEYKKFNAEFESFLSERNLAYIISPKYVPCEKESGAKTVGEMTFVKKVAVTEEKTDANTPSPFVAPESAA